VLNRKSERSDYRYEIFERGTLGLLQIPPIGVLACAVGIGLIPKICDQD
jgi:hypothetical protein